MNELSFSPTIFDPNKEQLQEIALEVSTITADPSKITKDELTLVSTTKNKLVKARTAIQKIGKAAREDALKYQRDVIAYEKELIEIIEPQELRLKKIASDAEDYAIREERKLTLQEFKEKLASIGDSVVVTDDELLMFDPNGRTEYYNTRLSQHLEQQKAEAEAKAVVEEVLRNAEQKRIADELAAEKAAIEREKREMEHQKELREAEERARKEAEEKAARDAEKREAARLADEKAEALRVAQEKAAQEAKEEYKKWLASCSFDESTDIVQENAGTYTLYRKVSEYHA